MTTPFQGAHIQWHKYSNPLSAGPQLIASHIELKTPATGKVVPTPKPSMSINAVSHGYDYLATG
jgi:hypothetical protein